MKDKFPTVELVHTLLLFAAPRENERKRGFKPELWAWEGLEELLPVVLHDQDVLPKVKDLLLREFLIPVIRGDIERPKNRGRGAPRQDTRDDFIFRSVELMTSGKMRKKKAFQEIRVVFPRLTRARIERIYYEQKAKKKS